MIFDKIPPKPEAQPRHKPRESSDNVRERLEAKQARFSKLAIWAIIFLVIINLIIFYR